MCLNKPHRRLVVHPVVLLASINDLTYHTVPAVLLGPSIYPLAPAPSALLPAVLSGDFILAEALEGLISLLGILGRHLQPRMTAGTWSGCRPSPP